MAYNDDFIVKNGLVVRATDIASYQSTSTTTGAIITPGGIGIGGSANIGKDLTVLSSSTFQGAQFSDIVKVLSTAINTSTITPIGNALQVSGGVYAENINIAGIALVKGSRVLTVAEGFTGGVISDPLIINTTTNSTSTTTGALVTPGGIGVGRDMHIGGNVWTTGTLYVNGSAYGSNKHLLTTLTTNPGAGISSSVTYNGYTATIITTNTGVLTAAGGTGISVNTSTGNITITNTGVISLTAGTDTKVTSTTGDITVWNVSTLQSVTDRGASTTNALTISNNNTGGSTSTGNALNVGGSIGALKINVANTSYIDGSQILTTSTVNQFIGGIINNTLRIANTTSSYNTQTGALVVDGGLGVGENINVGGALTVQGDTVIYGGLSVVGSYTTVLVNSTQTFIRDAAIDIGTGIGNAALTVNDGLDRGMVIHYNTGTSALYDNHAFFGRKAGASGELVYLTDVEAGGGTVNVSNPIVGGNYGTARFGKLRLVGGESATNNTTGDLITTGGIGVGGELYAAGLYDNNNRVITTLNLNSGTGISVYGATRTGSTLTVSIQNTGVLSLTPGIGLGVDRTTGDIIIQNLGVTAIQAGFDIAISTSTGTVSISDVSTLYSVTQRGNTTTTQIFINNDTTSTTSSGTNALVVQGGGYFKTLMVGDIAFINGSQVVTSATINSFSGGTINNSLRIASTLTSTNTDTGALTVAGGVGIGDNLNVLNTIKTWANKSSAVFDNNSLVISGGAAFAGNARFGLDTYTSGTAHVSTIASLGNNLYLTTGTGTGSVWANGVNLLNFDEHVFFVSDGQGSDTNDGRRPASAFKTLKYALSQAVAGDVIYLEAGTYTEVFPLTVPVGVSIRGAGIRHTTIQPTAGTNTQDCFLMNGETTITDILVTGFYKPGYAFKFATGAKITTRSPYVERVSVITRGSSTSSSDPYGFAAADAGNGAYLDAGVLDPTSLEPAMLWNEVTFIVPNATGWYMTNGARAELLNGFSYFADKAIHAVAGTTGYGGVGKTKIKVGGTITGTFGAGQTLTYRDANSNILAQGTIASVSGNYIYLSGPVWGFETITDREGKTVTTYGDAVQSTLQKKYGTTSGKFDGNGDYLEVLSDNDFQFGTGAYTIEAWVYLSTLGKVNRIFYKGTTSSSSIRLSVSASNVVQALHADTIITGSTALTTGQWYHVALSHSASGDFKLFLNGTLEATSSSATGSVNNTDPVSIGGISATPTDSLSGYLDDVRVSNNYRYSVNFTAPTAKLTSDSATILMLNADAGNGVTGFVDSASGTQNISSNGGATATRIELADYHQFGAELRCIGSAAVFGNSGVTANGTGTDLKLIAFNMSHIGAGGDLSDDISLVNQANEVIQINNGKVYFQTVDQSGDFRVGSSFVVNQRTGNVSFGNAQVNLAGLNQLTITDGTNNAVILPTSISVGNLNFAGGTIASLSGDITIDPSGTLTTINSDAQINGSLAITGSFSVPSVVDSTSTVTGAFTVAGGAGIGKNLNVGGAVASYVTASSTTTIASNALMAFNGGIGAKTLYIQDIGYIGNAQIVTTGTIGASLGGIIPNAIHITNTAPNNANTTSGALIVDGGVGIGGSLTVGGDLTLLGGGSVLTDIKTTTDAYIGASVVKAGTTATINIVNLGVQSLTAGSGIGVSASTGTITVSSTDTLQDVTSRGATTPTAISINNGSVNTATTAGNALTVAGGIGAKNLYLSDSGWINGNQIITTASLGQAFSSSTAVTGQFNITNTSSIAFQVAGGAAIGGTLTIGGNLNVAGTVTSIDSTSVDIGTKVIYLSTQSNSASLAEGSGIIIGKDDNNVNTDWATWVYDGGEPGHWQTTNGIKPMRNDLELGTATGYWWNTLYVKTTYFDEQISTSTAYNTTTSAGNALRIDNGGIYARTLTLTNSGWINGSKIVTAADFNTYATTFDGGTIHTQLIQTDATDAVSTTSGSIKTAGGIGIGKSLWVSSGTHLQASLDVLGKATFQDTTTSTSAANGSVAISGGVGILQNLRVGSNIDAAGYLAVGGNGTFTGDLAVTSGNLNLNSGSQNTITAANNLNLTATLGNVVLTPAGKVQVNSALSATGASYFDGAVSILNSTSAGTTTTGALKVLGGISTQGDIRVARDIEANETIFARSLGMSTSTISGNAIQAVNGGLGAQTLYLAQSGWINGAQIITSATLNSFTGGAIGNSLNITNNTNAISTTTGALVVAGGVGIGKDVYIGGSTYISGSLYVDGATFDVQSTTIQTGDKVIALATGTSNALAALGAGITIGTTSTPLVSWTYNGADAWRSTAGIVPTSGGLTVGSLTSPWGNVISNIVTVKNTTSATSTSTGALIVGTGGIGAQNIFLGSTFGSTVTTTYNALTAVGGAYIGGPLTVNSTDAYVGGNKVVTSVTPFDVLITSSNNAVNTQSGALQISGGIGLAKDLVMQGQLFVNNVTASTSTANTNALVVSGGGYFGSLMVTGETSVNGSPIVTFGNIGNFAFNGGTINNQIIINSSTQATSTITGALQVINGGAGIGGNLWVGGTTYHLGTSTFLNTATFKTISVGTSTFSSTATLTLNQANTATAAGNALQVTGGGSFGTLRVANQAWVNGSPVITAANINSFSGGTITNDLTINSPTQATSTVTGAFRVLNGGIGIGGNGWFGGSVNIQEPTGTVDAYFGAAGDLSSLNIGTNVTNTPVSIIVNNNKVVTLSTDKLLGIGTTAPIYSVDLRSTNSPAWSSGTLTNLVSFRSGYWADANSADTSRLAFGAISNDSGSTFEHWIASGKQSDGGGSPLVFAGGAWTDSNDLATNTVTEWARFSATGNFTAKNFIITTNSSLNTATIAGNALQVTGGIGASSINITGKGWINNSVIITAATIGNYQFNGGTITQPLYVNTNTQATSNTSGAIRTAGGISAVGNIYAGANFYGNLIATNITATNVNQTGQQINIAGVVNITTATDGGAGVGALVVQGGASLGGKVVIGSSAIDTTQVASNALQVTNGGIGAQTLYLAQAGYINGAQIVTSATINSFSGGTIAAPLYLSNTTDATSTSTGALTVAGGVGIGKNLWVGADLNVLGNLYVDGTTFTLSSTNIETGNKVIYLSTSSPNAAAAANAGIAVGPVATPYAALYFNGSTGWTSQANMLPSTAAGWDLGSSTIPWRNTYASTGTFLNSVDATSTQTGALQTVGGAGIGKSLVVGNTLNVQSSLFSIVTTTNNAIYTPGGVGAQYLYIGTNAYVAGSQVVTAANVGQYQYNGGVINNAIVNTSSTNATSVSTGSLVLTNGGAGIAKDMYVGGVVTLTTNTANTSTIAGNALSVTGGIGANSLYLATSGWINGSPIVTAATINSFSGGTINSSLTINDPTQATSTVTGALKVTNGGLGVGGNIYNGGIHVIGVTANQAATIGSTATGSLQVLGGASFSGVTNHAGNAWFGSNVGIQTTNPQQALEVNGNSVFGIYNGSRVQVTGGGGTNSIYEVATTESNPRWTIGRNLITSDTSGIGFVPANTTFAAGGAAVGAVSGLGGYLGMYTTNATSMTLRAVIDTNGNMGIGNGAGAPLAKLDVRGKIRVQINNDDNVILTNNAAGYTSLQLTRTATGSLADFRIGVGPAGNLVATAAQGDAVMTFGQNLLIASQSNYEIARFTPSQLQVNTATASVSSLTGAIITQGGIGLQGDLYVGATANIVGTTIIQTGVASTSSIVGNALQVTGGIGAKSIYLQQSGWINGYQIVTTQNVGSFTGAFNGGTVQNAIFIADQTDSGSTSTGALYTNGGVGITKQLYVGGNTTLAGTNVNITGNVIVTNATQASSTTTGALRVVNGGIGVGGNSWFGGVVQSAGKITTNGLAVNTVGTINTDQTTFTLLNATATTINFGGAATAISIGASAGTITAASILKVNNTTQATSTITGALQVVGGGAGIGGNLYVGGTLNAVGTSALQGVTAAGVVQITNATAATSTTTGALQVTGGVGIQGDLWAKNIYMNGVLVGTGGSGGSGSSTSTPYISVTSATIATSTGSGALIVTGGAGIGKGLFAGGPVVIGQGAYLDTSALLQVEGGIEASGAVVGSDHYSQSGNLLVQSSDFSTVNWTKPNSTYTAGAATSPDGTLNGTRLVETATNGNHYFQQTVSQTGPVTFSIYIAPGTRTFAIMNVTCGGQPHAVWFNLTTGAVASTVGTTYNTVGRIERMAYLQPGATSPQWYRCSVTVTAPQSATSTAVGVYTALGSDSAITGLNSSYVPAGGDYVYIFGAQFEPGYYPGDYIATAGASSVGTGNIYAGGSIYIANTGTVGGFPIVNSNNLMTYWGGSSANALTLTATTNATSTQTGVLQVVGGVGIGKDVWIGGTIYATAKSFLINHPSKPGYKLQYGSLEGPENGVYVRGKLDGTNTIELPDYWKDLVDETTITVDLTPIGKHQKLYVEDIVDNTVIVGNDNLISKTVKCFYVVWAERKDIGKLKVEHKG